MIKWLLCGVCLLPLALRAQSDTLPTRFVEVGLSAAAYRGDLNNAYQRWTPLAHLALHLQRRRRLNGSFQLTVGQVVGQGFAARLRGDQAAADGRQPNRDFRTSLLAANYALRLNVVSRPRFKVYLAQGVGLLRYVPRDREGNRLAGRSATLAPQEGYGAVTLFFPTAAGLLYALPNHYVVGVQAGWLNPTTDYLDNVGTYGTRNGNDNVAAYRFMLWLPLRPRPTPPPAQN